MYPVCNLGEFKLWMYASLQTNYSILCIESRSKTSTGPHCSDIRNLRNQPWGGDDDDDDCLKIISK